MSLTFSMRIDMSNAAFFPPVPELTRILRDVAQKIEDGGDGSGPILDINGNKVGFVQYTR